MRAQRRPLLSFEFGNAALTPCRRWRLSADLALTKGLPLSAGDLIAEVHRRSIRSEPLASESIRKVIRNPG